MRVTAHEAGRHDLHGGEQASCEHRNLPISTAARKAVHIHPSTCTVDPADGTPWHVAVEACNCEKKGPSM